MYSLCSSVSSRLYSLSGGRQWGQRACDLAVTVEGPVSTLPSVWRCLEPGTYVLRDLQVAMNCCAIDSPSCTWRINSINVLNCIILLYCVLPQFYHTPPVIDQSDVDDVDSAVSTVSLDSHSESHSPKCHATASGSSTENLSSGED